MDTPFPTISEAETIPAIHRALKYADQFEQAVSAHDIARYLDIPSDIANVQNILQRYAGDEWQTCDGYYCLPDRANLVAQTRERAAFAQIIWPQARKWAAFLARIPYVRMIAVTGSLAMNNCGPGADIDYLVITAPGRVWTARLFIIGLVRFARLSGVDLCPNFILSTQVLRMHQETFFIARELAQMVPLYGQDYYQKMIEANDWMLRFLPCATSPPAARAAIALSPAAIRFKAAGERVLGIAMGQKLEDWECNRKIARLQSLPGAEKPNVILSSEQCKGHFRGTGT